MYRWLMYAMKIGSLLILISCVFATDLHQQQYIGCYRDEGNNRAMGLPNQNTSMTLEMCLERCRYTMFTYFGVEYWHDCYCHDTFNKHGPVNNSYCNTQCSGNHSQICGGNGALSVYTVCPTGKYGKPCNDSCHCKNSSVYGTVCFRNGMCPDGCQTGWSGTKCERDINECETTSGQQLHNCAHHCTNIPGSYNCTCWPGFTSYDDGRNCTDIDECQVNNGGCNHTCKNTPGSRVCSCHPGYKLVNETQCPDIDECATNKGNCSHNCTNTPGSRMCSCADGYTLDNDNRTCNDINECENKNGGCQHNCNNSVGSFNCSCNQGFQPINNTHCEDIDECLSGYGGCEVNCTNTQGSFYCGCKDGYRLNDDNKTCSDIDECLDSSKHQCSQNCSNSPGSFSCYCMNGFTLNGDRKTCDDYNECENKTLNVCAQKCENTPGSFKCLCNTPNTDGNAAYSVSANGFSCDNINECKDKTAKCHHYCFDIHGDYTCSCMAGYTLDHRKCIWTIWLVIVPLVCSAVFLILLAAAVFFVVRWRRAKELNRPKTSYSDNGSVDSMDTLTDFNPKATAIKLKNNGKQHTSHNNPACKPIETSVDYPDDENPIYANFETGNTDASKTCVRVRDIPTLVQRINEMPEYLKAEYQKLTMSTDASIEFAQKPELKPKNRFKNILPYDSSRVKLSKIDNNPLSTYINASFIVGYTEDEKLIASHGPTNNTINDFWRMIWEYNVGVIVMVTKCHEELKTKCEQYWPETCVMDFGEIKTEPHSTEERIDRIVRKLNVWKEGEAHRLLTQIQFIDWPDHGVPEHAVSLLAIRHAVKRIVTHDQYIVVHCSAGVGRTGTYLAIDYLLSQAVKEGFVDVCNCVKQLRAQRMHCVQTLDQYSFIFKALHEGLVLGETTLTLAAFREHVAELRLNNPMTKKPFLDTEFELLQKMQPLPDESMCADAMSEDNKSKNRNPKLLPMDNRRVYITQRTKGRTDYINAVYVPCLLRSKGYISTQLPLEKTVGDFWNMCIDYKCKIIVFFSHAKSADDVYSFLPKSKDKLQFGKSAVFGLNEVAAKENEPCQLMTVIASRGDNVAEAEAKDNCVYANAQEPDGKSDDGSRVTIVQVIMPDNQLALRKGLLKARDQVLDLQTKASATVDKSPIVIMSRDGVEFCGQFIAVCNLCDMINTQQEVDVFQTVYNIKRAQPHFFTDMAVYEELYRTVEWHLDQTTLYSNS